MLAHAKHDGFETLDEHERVERRHGGADVAQQRDARLDDVGDGAERLHGLGPDRAVVARVRRVEHGETIGVLLPVEIAAIHDDAADRRPMAADVLGRRVHGDGGAMPDGLAQDRTGGVVHDERHADFAPDPGDLRNREYRELGIGQRLAIIAARARVGRTQKVFRIGGIDEATFDPHRAQRVLEQVPGAAINIGRADEIVAGVADVLHREQRGRLPGSHRERRHAALERRHPLLQHGLGRIPDAGVDVAQLFQGEQIAGVFGRIELVRRRLIDRHRNRGGRRVGTIPCVQDYGFRVLARRRHASSVSMTVAIRGGH